MDPGTVNGPSSTPKLGSGWTLLTTGSAPGVRANASMAFDPADGEVVLFGGWNGGYLGDTWTFRAGTWSQLSVSSGPSARAGAALAYDPVIGGLVLFGGTNGSGLSDTWLFQGGLWAPLHFTNLPPARSGAVAAFDPSSGTLVLFGGVGGKFLSDTWALSSAGWTQLSLVVHPPAEAYSAFTYDASDGYLLLTGGGGPNPSAGTWAFDAGAWSKLVPAKSPSARMMASLTYDAADGGALLFGGMGTDLSGQTWRYQGGLWTSLSYPTHPSNRSGASMAFDLSDGYVLLFGGMGKGLLGDTWGFKIRTQSPGWNIVTTGGGPTYRQQGVTAFDPIDGYAVMFGGWNNSATDPNQTFYNDTWIFKAGVWTQLHLPLSPSPRRGSAFVYDAADGYLLLFGGSDGHGYLSDTWSFRAGSWTHLTVGFSPPPRRSAAIAYDEKDGYVLLFGGHNGNGVNPSKVTFFYHLGDTWTYRAGVWTNITTPIHPSARSEPEAAYDPPDGYVLLYGGYIPHQNGHGDIEQKDTWKFSAGTWTNITASMNRHPGPKDGENLLFDANHGYLIMFGGDTPFYPRDVWAYRNGWTELCGNCTTNFNSASHAAFDASDGYVVYLGGTKKGVTATISWVAPVGVKLSASLYGFDAGHPVLLRSVTNGGVPPLQYLWSLGDGNSSPVASPTVVFTIPGVVAPKLVVTDSTGLSAVASLTLTVNPSLRVSAVPDPTITDLGQPVQFGTSISGGTAPYSYTWSFGDGTSSTFPTPVHNYSAPGSVSGTVTITDASRESARAAFNVTVESGPSASIVSSANQTDVGIPVSVNGSAGQGVGPYEYAWNFGDGSNGSGPALVHSFTQAGNFLITLRVTDAIGVASEAAILLPVHDLPTATLTASENSSDVGLPVLLNGYVVGGTAPFQLDWAFGDGSNATGLSPQVHRFAAAGAYTVIFNVTDALGQVATDSVVVTIGSLPLAAIVASNNVTDVGLPISLLGSATSGTGPFEFTWTYGDGSTGVGSNTTHVYNATGLLLVNLTVTDRAGSAANASVSIRVNPPLLAWATIPSVTDVGTNVTFNATVSGGTGPIQSSWEFGDNTSLTGPNASHAFSTPGTYNITVRWADSAGAVVVQSGLLEVNPLPVGMISDSANGSVAAGQPDMFSANLTGGTGPYTFRWDFGDGNGSASQNASHTFDSAGNFTVTLIVTDAAGVQVVVTTVITVTEAGRRRVAEG